MTHDETAPVYHGDYVTYGGRTMLRIRGGDGTEEADAGKGANDEKDGTGDSPEEKDGTETQDADKDASGDEPFDKDRAKAKITKANSEAANLRKRLKELEPLAAKAKELEDANKSESEKLTEAKTSAEKDAAAAKAEVARLRVALKKGLNETQAKRLIGESEEDLEADADELLASFKKDDDTNENEDDDKKAPEADRRPKERLRPGAAPGAEPEETDPAALASRVSRDW